MSRKSSLVSAGLRWFWDRSAIFFAPSIRSRTRSRLKRGTFFSAVDIYPRISLNSDVFARQRAITPPKIQKVEYGACLCASKRDRERQRN